MGIKSATKTNVSEDKYEIKNLVFSSRVEYQIIKIIDRNLRRLYKSVPPNSVLFSENYIPLLDNDVNRNDILDKVVDGITGLYVEGVEEVKIKENVSEAFNRKFLGLMNFFYEAQGLICEDIILSDKRLEGRIIDLLKRLWCLGIHPGKF